MREGSREQKIGITVNDLTGRFIIVNRHYCELTGYSEQELKSRNFQLITHPDDVCDNWRLARRLSTGDLDSAVYEKRYIRKDGQIIRVRNSVRLVFDAAGNPASFVVLSELVGRAGAEPADCALSPFRLISATSRELAELTRKSMTAGRAPQFFAGLATTVKRLGPQDVGLASQCSKVSALETSDEDSPCRLTTREIEVVKRIAEGKTTKEVAAILGITYKTAACHRSHIMEKLGIHDIATLVRYAIREGIVRP
jgi:PAS domain S-box-containing protein